jgi:hypothetical protein
LFLFNVFFVSIQILIVVIFNSVKLLTNIAIRGSWTVGSLEDKNIYLSKFKNLGIQGKSFFSFLLSVFYYFYGKYNQNTLSILKSSIPRQSGDLIFPLSPPNSPALPGSPGRVPSPTNFLPRSPTFVASGVNTDLANQSKQPLIVPQPFKMPLKKLSETQVNIMKHLAVCIVSLLESADAKESPFVPMFFSFFYF